MPALAVKPLDGAWYGTNYTVPFAHAYRALGHLGIDRKEAIERDVYHMSRLGLNAFRLHLWDVELTDSVGNLIDNDHLDLLDYLIAALERRGIDITLTAQTNFGNGYPERNTDPYGAFTYRYSKCGIHEDKEAQKAQRRYLSLLASHINPYTGKSYAADPSIVAMEINNEPCHTGSQRQVEQYVRSMIKTLRKAGWDKPILYNVSHNPDVTPAYFRAPIDGATYQWYPLGLVSGHTRQGNFLPYVDNYDIPFDTLPGFDLPAKVIYEYDPADNLAAYIFPAAVRTLRSKGFNWITQFAYDPIDMARFNSEYQTHFLNLAYTPGKALAMMIAAEVMRRTPVGADYGKYPTDTIFGPFIVSARRNLSIMNTPDSLIYSNTMTEAPVNFSRLRMVAGVGSSPVVKYDGTGAYFLDRVDSNVWRLEVMPSVTIISDPFAKPSLTKEVAVIDTLPCDITINLPGLASDYLATPMTRGNKYSVRAYNGRFNASPGVYLLSADNQSIADLLPNTPYAHGKRRLGEYVMPPLTEPKATIVHQPAAIAIAGDSILIDVTTIGPADAVTVYPGNVSFWALSNSMYPMTQVVKGRWQVKFPTSPDADEATYTIVTGTMTPDGYKTTTYPGGLKGAPLDWDFLPGQPQAFTTSLHKPGQPIPLVTASPDLDGSSMATIPGQWEGISYRFVKHEPLGRNTLTASATTLSHAERIVIGKYVAPLIRPIGSSISPDATITMALSPDTHGADSIGITVVNADGFTYSATAPIDPSTLTATARLSEMKPAPTLLNPEPFPTFLSREWIPDYATVPPLSPNEIEELRIVAHKQPDRPLSLSIYGIWLNP
ncbi:MAG: cellulase family glycosylhydrolase [Alloprevotella sp.]|nr:cellulase family glycosylhydrolase [Alloprevotella sp.]